MADFLMADFFGFVWPVCLFYAVTNYKQAYIFYGIVK